MNIEHPYRVNGPVTIEEARRYCERLAKSHYENFLVAGIFCPKPLRQHFYNVYAYCRISDDLSDEIGDPRKSLILLDWWEDELDAMYRGTPRHPVFVALAETVEKFGIPADAVPQSAHRLPAGSGNDALPDLCRTFSATA